MLEHAPRHPLTGPTPRRCPLLAGVDTITYRDRQFPACAMSAALLTRHSPSRCLRNIGHYTVILRERQHQGPILVRPELGLWVSWQKHDVIAPLCAVCLEYLYQREAPEKKPATIYVLPEYDSIGQRYRGGLTSLSPVELAQLRMAEVESKMPRAEPAAGAHDAAAIARQAFMETAGILRALGNLWKEQRPARLKLGQHMMGLQTRASVESLKEFDDILGDLPGAMQAYVEAKTGPGSGGT